MTEEQKREVATFRFGVIHDLVNRMDLEQGEQERLLREKSSRKWSIPFSDRTRICRTTMLRWIRIYKRSGGKLESLAPPDRSDRGRSRVLDDETVLSLIHLRRAYPKAPLKTLIARMEERSPGVQLSLTTVYRLLAREGLMKPEEAKKEDRRKYEAELPNDLWQSDVMHGPLVREGERMRKAYLIALLDDHSRLVPHAAFHLNERLSTYLEVFEAALLKRGLPRKLYSDNGAAYRSKHLEQVCASLGIALIHARPYQPQGKGKIERFFRHVRDSFLTSFDGGTLEDLNRAFAKWLDGYHERKHRSTAQSPFERFTANMACVRSAPRDLRDHFRKRVRRRVTNDRTITLEGRLFEAPVALIGKQVDLLYHEGEESVVEIVFGGGSFGLAHPVDLHVNCRIKRDKNRSVEMRPPRGGDSRHQGGSLWERKEEL
jgi:transposase InsO family protein